MLLLTGNLINIRIADLSVVTGGTCGFIVLITSNVTEADDVQHGGHILLLYSSQLEYYILYID